MAAHIMHARICAVDGCDGPRYKRDWCSKHYRAWWTHGDPHYVARPDNGGRCSVIGCSKPPRSRTSPHCEMHYGRLRRNGSLDNVMKAHVREHSNGYLLIPARGHPMALGGSHAYEHRVVFYDAHGPGPHACHICGEVGMLSDQHVDHLNEAKTDNRLENLKAACPECNPWRDKDRVKMARKAPHVHWIEFGGERLPLSRWAERIGISAQSLGLRLRNGWPIERALTAPRGITGPHRRPAVGHQT